MQEYLVSFYEPITNEILFSFFIREKEYHIISEIHLFCEEHRRTRILDIISDFKEKYISYTSFVEKLLKWSKNHFKSNVSVLRTKYSSKNNNITSRLNNLLSTYDGFVRCKVR